MGKSNAEKNKGCIVTAEMMAEILHSRGFIPVDRRETGTRGGSLRPESRFPGMGDESEHKRIFRLSGWGSRWMRDVMR